MGRDCLFNLSDKYYHSWIYATLQIWLLWLPTPAIESRHKWDNLQCGDAGASSLPFEGGAYVNEVLAWFQSTRFSVSSLFKERCFLLQSCLPLSVCLLDSICHAETKQCCSYFKLPQSSSCRLDVLVICSLGKLRFFPLSVLGLFFTAFSLIFSFSAPLFSISLFASPPWPR